MSVLSGPHLLVCLLVAALVSAGCTAPAEAGPTLDELCAERPDRTFPEPSSSAEARVQVQPFGHLWSDCARPAMCGHDINAVTGQGGAVQWALAIPVNVTDMSEGNDTWTVSMAIKWTEWPTASNLLGQPTAGRDPGPKSNSTTLVDADVDEGAATSIDFRSPWYTNHDFEVEGTYKAEVQASLVHEQIQPDGSLHEKCRAETTAELTLEWSGPF